MRYVSAPHAYPESTGRHPATIMLALALVAALGGCIDRSAGSTKPAEFVRTQVVRSEQNQGSVTLTGQLRARFQAQLSFRVSGRVVARFVDVGAHVDAGQLLATIDPAEQQADVDAASAAVVAADFRSRIAKTTFDRQNTLLADGFTTRVAFDQAQEELRNAESSLEAANAQLGTAKDYLGYTELRAGVAGIITERHLEIGQVVQAAQPVFTLAQDGERDAVFDVSESMLLRDVDGSAVSLALVSDPSIAAIGHVREVSPAVDQRSLTIRVKVAIENSASGNDPRKRRSRDSKTEARCPDHVAVDGIDGNGVETRRVGRRPGDAAVAMRPVTIANHEAGLVVIEQGLEPGDRVVVDGGKLLSSGQYVRYDKDPS